MRESRPSGSEEGAVGNHRPYSANGVACSPTSSVSCDVYMLPRPRHLRRIPDHSQCELTPAPCKRMLAWRIRP